MCAAGVPHRKALKARIDKQHARLDHPPETEEHRLTAPRGEGYGIMTEIEEEAEASLTV